MLEIPLDEIFSIDLGARPATYIEDYTAAVPVVHEIAVAFLRDQADTFGVQNANPVAWAKTIDLPNLGTKSKLIVHYGYLLDEAGNRMIAENGEAIIAEAEYTYFVVPNPHQDAFGVTKMELTLTAPN